MSASLKIEFPDATGFSPRNLARMRKFYETYGDISNLPPAVAKLPWTHNSILVERIENPNKRIWYAEKCLENGWNKVVLDHQIDLDLYDRQSDNSKKLTNFYEQLPEVQGELAVDVIKDPYIFELAGLNSKSKELDIEKAMIERIKSVLLELGKGFSFVGNQYKVTVDNQDFYIDLLFYHIKLKCYIAVELKVVEFKPEFASKMGFYLTALDEEVKDENDNPSIGLILCQNKSNKIVDYTLKYINKPVGVSEYKIFDKLSNDILKELPTEDDINLHINIDDE